MLNVRYRTTLCFVDTSLKAVRYLDVLRYLQGLIIPWKNSQNSLKTGICLITVYYRERLQINVNQRKKYVGLNARQHQIRSFRLSSPRGVGAPPVCGCMCGVLPAKEAHPPKHGCSVFIGAPSCRYG